jgi:RNA polymerase sigma-70 factor (family 1)
MGKRSEGGFNDHFRDIYVQFFDGLIAYAVIITKSEAVAKDVVSEVFFNLWKAQTDFSSIRNIKAYLFASVKNQAIRTHSSDPILFYADSDFRLNSSIDRIDPEELFIGDEMNSFLAEVVENLPLQCRLVFNMVKERDMKYAEVASELNISLDTVKYHLKTALKRIRSELTSHFKDNRIIRMTSNIG